MNSLPPSLATLQGAALALQRGDFQASRRLCAQVLSTEGDNPAALTLMGFSCAAQGLAVEALEYLDRALAQEPRLLPVAQARADLLRDLGRHREALAAYDALLLEAPANVGAHNSRGGVLRALRHFSEALAAFARVRALEPGHAAAGCNYGITLHDLGRSEEAVLALRKTLEAHPDHSASLHNLGLVLHSIDRHEEAASCYERLLALDADFPGAAASLLKVRLAVCDWSHYAQQLAPLRDNPAAVLDPMTALTVLSGAREQRARIQCFTERHFPEMPALAGTRVYDQARIRVVYLSADFQDHPVAHLLAGVLEQHQRQDFEVLGVSLKKAPAGDWMHARLRRAFEHFLDASELSDEQIARYLHDWRADLVVDLNGHTRGGRLGILARRCAPIQVSFLGFAGTMGARYVDYLIADGVVLPEAQDSHYAERIVRLPPSFLPSDDSQALGPVPTRAALGLPEDGLVFCAFSNAYKITPDLFAVWLRLLERIPGSVLWLRAFSAAAMRNLARAASAAGIDQKRLVFAARVQSLASHLSRLQAADLFLDTSPYGAHATARDALYAGLPVLTLMQGAMASRVAASLLTALDLPELICARLEEYEARALQIAREPMLLAKLKARLHSGRAAFATHAYRDNLERSFRTMWQINRGGGAARSFEVPPQSPHLAI